MSAEATITTAIHNIKSNRGSETPGVDFKTMRKDYLQRSHSWVIRDIQSAFQHFEPQQIRRKYIDKPGKTEKRPLGIPTIRDRIVQECMRWCWNQYLKHNSLPTLMDSAPCETHLWHWNGQNCSSTIRATTGLSKAISANALTALTTLFFLNAYIIWV